MGSWASKTAEPSQEEKAKAEAEAKRAAAELKKRLDARPVRPRGLREDLLRLHLFLALTVAAFVALSLGISHEVPEGKFELQNGTFIDLAAFDPAELGPFPRCHPHHGEHEGPDGAWVKNDDVGPKDGADEADFAFPVGHPKNKAWRAKREAQDAESKLSFLALQPSVHLLLLAVTTVYLGCKHSAWMYVKPDPKLDAEDTELDEDIGQSALQDGDAYMFPVMGSAVLFGLFVVYKYLGSELIKYLFSCYVVVMCTNGLGINIGQFVALVQNSRGLSHYRTLFTIPYLDARVTWVDVVAYLFSAALGVQYILTKNWIINNVMGISFCLLGLKHIGISSYKTGLIMLVGLFVYDVFWVFGSKSVFGSNVMVTVATGVEAPIKLMFPRSQDGCGKMMFSMLGLGDIVVPGVTISLLAKFDTSRPDAKERPGWQYLDWTMLAYTLSLVTTVAIMLIFNHAQPALLYIVPYIIFSSFATAMAKGQRRELFDFVVEDTMIALEDVVPETKSKKTQ